MSTIDKEPTPTPETSPLHGSVSVRLWRPLKQYAEIVTAIGAVISLALFPALQFVSHRLTRASITRPVEQTISDGLSGPDGKQTWKIVQFELSNPGPATLKNVKLMATVKKSDNVFCVPISAGTTWDRASEAENKNGDNERITAVPNAKDGDLAAGKRIGIIMYVAKKDWGPEKVEAVHDPGPTEYVYSGNNSETAFSVIQKVLPYVMWVAYAGLGGFWLYYLFFRLPANENRIHADAFSLGHAKGSKAGYALGFDDGFDTAAETNAQTVPNTLLPPADKAIQSAANLEKE